ncbi:MAG: hypothetical protein ACK56I_03640, partial [bacterium]
GGAVAADVSFPPEARAAEEGLVVAPRAEARATSQLERESDRVAIVHDEARLARDREVQRRARAPGGQHARRRDDRAAREPEGPPVTEVSRVVEPTQPRAQRQVRAAEARSNRVRHAVARDVLGARRGAEPRSARVDREPVRGRPRRGERELAHR